MQLGAQIYSFDPDPVRDEARNIDPGDYAVTRLPEKYFGADYIITRADRSRDLYFFAEQDIDVYMAIDSRNNRNPSGGWTATADTMAIQEGTTYRIMKKSFPMGETVLLKAWENTGRSCFYMILPTNGQPVSRLLTHEDVIPAGTKPAQNAADQHYQYYWNEVFNTYDSADLPSGYTGNGAALNDNTVNLEAGVNLALGASYSSSATWNGSGSPVDGDTSTYWESNGLPGQLTIDFQGRRQVNQVTLRLRDYWGNRTQNLEVQGSLDGETFTSLLPAKDYLFENYLTNTLQLSFEETQLRYLRIIGRSNTGAQGIQLSEVEVYGPAQRAEKGSDRYAVLEKREKGDDAVWMEKALEHPAAGSLVFEARVKSSEKNQRMYIPQMQDNAGRTAVSLCFGEDGYIKAATRGGEVNIAPYTSDTWYTLRILLNTKTEKYQVWVNHLRKAENIDFAQTAVNIQTVRFSVEKKAAGTLLVDSIRLYDDPEVYILDETFDDLETGSRPDENWHYTHSSAAEIAEVPFAGDKSLKLTSDGAPTHATRSFTPLQGDVTVEAKIKADASGWVTVPAITDAQGKTAVKVAAYRNSFFINNGSNWVYLCDQEVPNNYYPAGNWYYVKIVLNTYTKRYDFYIDGAKRYSGAAFAEEIEEVSRVTLGTEQENILYVDQLKVYDSASLARGLMPEESVYNVKDYGAKGDGVTDDTKAIGAAIADAAGTGGTVLLENGVFYTGQITLQSDMTLFIDASATLFANMDRNVYDKHIPSRGYNGNHQLGRGIIYGEKVSNVRITGGGTVYGNGFYALNENDPPNQRPCILYIALSKDITIENLNLVQSPFWTLVPYESENITVRNVNITNHVAPNRDGIDPVNCSNMTVENCHIIAGDDAFCPKSGNDIPSLNIDVRNTSMQSYCNGIKFGTDTYDDFKNYTFEDICMKCVGLSGITLQATDGSDMENITFRRIDMNDVDNVMYICVGNRERSQDVNLLPKKLGRIRNILVEDMNYTNPMQPPYSHKGENVHEAILMGLNPSYNNLNDGEDHRLSNVQFKNVYMESVGSYNYLPDFYQGLGGGYPEHTDVKASRGWAYTIRWADNVTFEHCTNRQLYPQLDKLRPEIAVDEATYSADPVVDSMVAQYVLGLADQKVPVGTAEADLTFPDAVPVLLENNQVVRVPVTDWMPAERYDAETPGFYRFTASLLPGLDVLGIDGQTVSVLMEVSDTPDVLLGDMNQDERLSVTDVVLLRRAILSNAYVEIGDMNQDKKLSVTDVVLLRRAILSQT